MSTSSVSADHGHSRKVKRDSRLNTRLTPELKDLFEHAAAVSGQTLTQFVLNAARQSAEALIQQHEIITLSVRDSRAVMEALKHPKPANAALRQAAQLHREMVGDE
jgi:uncharacterized protein (DUF1778 family)